jgi:hypothetical protein
MRTVDHFVQVAGQHPVHRMANEHEFEKGLIGKLEIF